MLDSLMNFTENTRDSRNRVPNTIFPELISLFFSFFQRTASHQILTAVTLTSHHIQRIHLHRPIRPHAQVPVAVHVATAMITPNIPLAHAILRVLVTKAPRLQAKMETRN